MRKLLARLGRKRLERESPTGRERQGVRVEGGTRVGLLVPASSYIQRIQLRDLIIGMDEMGDDLDWSMVVDTGMKRKTHTRSRAQRIQKIGGGLEVPPEFPQRSQMVLFWRDECNALGLPNDIPKKVTGVDVLLSLDVDQSSLPLLAMMKRSNAGFKVGPMHAEDGTLDFMLTWPDGGDMLSFVQLALHYLKTLDLK